MIEKIILEPNIKDFRRPQAEINMKPWTADKKICCSEQKLAILAAILNMQISQILGRPQAEAHLKI